MDTMPGLVGFHICEMGMTPTPRGYILNPKGRSGGNHGPGTSLCLLSHQGKTNKTQGIGTLDTTGGCGLTALLEELQP